MFFVLLQCFWHSFGIYLLTWIKSSFFSFPCTSYIFFLFGLVLLVDFLVCCNWGKSSKCCFVVLYNNVCISCGNMTITYSHTHTLFFSFMLFYVLLEIKNVQYTVDDPRKCVVRSGQSSASFRTRRREVR